MLVNTDSTAPHSEAELPEFKLENEAHLASSAGPVAGVYLLMQDDKVRYVGQSSNISLRLKQHRKEQKKRFNKVLFYHIVSEIARLRLEGILILWYVPIYNRGINLGLANGDNVWEIRWKRPRRV